MQLGEQRERERSKDPEWAEKCPFPKEKKKPHFPTLQALIMTSGPECLRDPDNTSIVVGTRFSADLLSGLLTDNSKTHMGLGSSIFM